MTMQTGDVRHGILKAWDAGTYTATVQFTGALIATYIASIPVARNIAGGEMTVGRKVAVAFFDPSNPADSVLFAVWA